MLKCIFIRFVDVDECKKNPNICGNGGKCENLDGSFKCSGCKNGALLNKDKTKCVGPGRLVRCTLFLQIHF